MAHACAGVVAERDGERFEIRADLTVDCTGRGSHAPRLLPEMGFDSPGAEPGEDQCRLFIALLSTPPGDLVGARVVLIFPQPPDDRRGGALMPVEGDRWLCTLGGWAARLSAHRSRRATWSLHAVWLRPTSINVISKAEPLVGRPSLIAFLRISERTTSAYLGFRKATWCWAMPSAASIHSMVRACQRRRFRPRLSNAACGGIAAKASRFGFLPRPPSQLIRPGKWPIGEDFRFRGVTGPRPRGLELGNRYVGMVHRAVTRDAQVYSRFLRVLNLLDPPVTLFRPGTVLRCSTLRSNASLVDRDAARIHLHIDQRAAAADLPFHPMP